MRCAVKWYQLHLSTVLLLTVLAGVFLGAQFWERENLDLPQEAFVEGGLRSYSDCHAQGWPLGFGLFLWRENQGKVAEACLWFSRGRLALNVISALVALALAAYVSEKIIRRKKHDNPT